jgi:hypothetical protein
MIPSYSAIASQLIKLHLKWSCFCGFNLKIILGAKVINYQFFSASKSPLILTIHKTVSEKTTNLQIDRTPIVHCYANANP